MSLYVCVCMYVYVCMCMYVCVCILCMYVCMHTLVCEHVCMQGSSEEGTTAYLQSGEISISHIHISGIPKCAGRK
jgi:hypothetical protein